MSSGRLAAALALVALTGCAAKQVSDQPAATGEPAALADPPRRPGKPLVLVAMPDAAAFRTVRRAVVAEIQKDFDVVTEVIDRRSTPASFGARLEAAHPTALVLMDNPTIRLYRGYLLARLRAPLPAVVVMSSFLEELRAELPNSSGVSYEVPGVTAFVNLRSVIARPVSRVGVVHRPPFRGLVGRQRALAAKEEITLVPVEVASDPSASDVRSALRSLRTTGQIDALWVLNDNGLLKDAAFLESVWRPELEALAVPVVVGVPTLVSAQARFGNFAVLPDLEALGVQAANVLFEIAENNWKAGAHPVELPVSTVTVGNLRQLEQRFGLREGADRRIDKVVE
jgi:putative ABC transport system substrate-binding protein